MLLLRVMYTAPTLIAEIGCNHQGRMDVAMAMIDSAARTGAVKYVKFQKRNPKQSLSSEKFRQPHPNPAQSFGDTYGEHRERLEFSALEHRDLKLHCEARGLQYACSVWDLDSAEQIISLNPDYIKIPSAANLNFELLDFVAQSFSGPIHISLGMTTALEVLEIERFLVRRDCLSRTIFYACTSEYPAPPEHCHLLEIPRLINRFQGRAAGVGYSGHHLGTTLDIVAFTLGARWIERHFTLDRSLKGSDQAISLLPVDFMALDRSLQEAYLALTHRGSQFSDSELAQRQKLKDL